jgi:hypothetical protein
MAGSEPTLIAETASQSDDHVTNAAHWCVQEQFDAALADWADETAEAPPIFAVILMKEFPTKEQMSTVTGLGGVCLKRHAIWQRACVQEDQVMDEALEGFQMDG